MNRLGIALTMLGLTMLACGLSVSEGDIQTAIAQTAVVDSNERQPAVEEEPNQVPEADTEQQNANTIPDDWTVYRNDDLGFSAWIPARWEPVVHESTPDNPMTAVSFAPSFDESSPDATVISVLAFPAPSSFDNVLPQFTAELRRFAEEWGTDRGLRLIGEINETKIGNNSAVSMVHEDDAVDGSYTVRAYAAFVAAPGWSYYLEVAGFAEYDDTLRQFYEVFSSGFTSPPN